MIVLDTSAVIELAKGTEKGRKAEEFLRQEAAAISAITLNELLVGASEKQKLRMQNFISSLHVLPFDAEVSHASVGLEEQLERAGKMIGKLDIFIAATCIVHDLQLITADHDFKHVKGLRLFVV